MNNSRKRTYIRIISLLSFLSLVFGISTVVYATRADRYKFAAEISSQRAINELCESLDNITVNLQKSLFTGTSQKLTQTAGELYREASIAKVCLDQLTDQSINDEEIYKFLSQVGAFTSFATKSRLTSEQKQQLQQLYDYSLSLSDEMSKVRDGYFGGTVAFSAPENSTVKKEQIPTLFPDAVNDFEQALSDYPTLIYDGPFSDNLLNKKSVFLKNKKEFSKTEAAEIAAKVLGSKPSELHKDKDIDGEIGLYSFSKGDVSISVTKKGGYICQIMSMYSPDEATISAEEAVSRGRDYLSQLGYKNMTSTYYSVYDGICTVNYAYKKEGITCYPDLIKVGIALDTGETVSLDASTYLMNHTERELPKATATAEDAVKNLASGLDVISVKKALIPLKTGKEALCYEIHCKNKHQQQALVYVDCATLTEQDILLLLYADEGILTK